LSVLAAGAPPVGYQWQKGPVNLTDGGRIFGSTNNILTIIDTVPSDSGYYQLGMSNLCGMTLSQPILLNVTTGPGTVAIGASSGAGGNTVITWSDNAAVLQTATNVMGPWNNITNAGSPYTINPGAPVQFFRLFYP
jgi:hypothetical protein